MSIETPETELETGTWDDEGSIRGWTMRPEEGSRIADFVIEEEFDHKDLTCLLIRVTEYHESGRYTRTEPTYKEWETYYMGFVHAPSVESFPKGYGKTYIIDCYPDDGWYAWSERSWSNRYDRRKSVREWAVSKTTTLAHGLARRKRGDL